MAHVRMRAATYSIEHGGRLAPGQLVEVEDEVAKRWLKNGLAADKDDKEAQAALSQSTDALQAEVARLNAQIARMQAGQGEAPSLPDDTSPYDQTSELASLGLTEQQRANLARAGFQTRQQIADASDDELLEVGGIGAATITRLREGAPGEAGPFGTDRGSKAITKGPGSR